MTPRVNLPDDRGFTVFVFFDDHPPPHVHLAKGDGKAAIALGNEATRPYLLRASGMKQHEIKEALRVVETHQAPLLNAWRSYNAYLEACY